MQEIRLPRLGWSMEQGTFVRWLVQPGSAVAVGQALFELEGDKALQEIESVDAGVLHVPADAPSPGSVVAVGTLLGYLLVAGEQPPAAGAAAASQAQTAIGASGAAASSQPPHAPPSVRRLARELGVSLHELAAQAQPGRITSADVSQRAERQDVAPPDVRTFPAGMAKGHQVVASPRARRLAAELDIDWTVLRGTGRDGRIREVDIRTARSAPGQAATPHGAPGQPAGLSPRRQAIADRLRVSRDRTIPVTLTTTADATNLLALRRQFKAAQAQVVPAYTDILACLVARVLRRHPQLAVRWTDDGRSLIAVAETDIHIGIAVDAPAGLLVPIVRHVASKSLPAGAAESAALVERARAGRLSSTEMQSGVLSISNLGGHGIDAFTPIINYPEIAILGVGAIRREAVVLPDDRIVPQDRVTLSLTFDHAAVDGAPAAAFLRDVVSAVENPAASLLEG